MRLKRWIIPLLLILLVLSFVGCQTKTESLSIEFTNPVFRKDLFINREYSIDDIVEKEDGVKYLITDCFYFDKEFNKIDIETDGKSFTQTAPYNVVLTVTASKGKSSVSESLELKINFNTTPILESFASSWQATGIIRNYSANPEYLTGNAETALAVRYMGDWNVENDGVSLGGFSKAYSSFSVTDWSNAVMVMDIYNAAEYEIEFGYQVTKDGQTYGKNNGISLVETLPAGEWSKITWSLRSIGFSENYFEKGGAISLRSRCNDNSFSAPYDYTLYFCNMDVVDYSAEKFPDLETRTPEEIRIDELNAKREQQEQKYQSLTGDELDKKLSAFAEGDSNFVSTTIESDKVEGQSSLQYTFTNDGVNRGYYANLTSVSNFLLDENSVLYNAYKDEITDWSTAYVGFWVKNTSVYSLEIALRFQTAIGAGDDKQWQGTVLKYEWYQAKANISANTSWKYVEMSLASIAENADNMYGNSKGQFYKENVTDLKFCLAVQVCGATTVGDTATFYIDCVNVYNKASSDPTDEMLIRDDKNSEIRLQTINRDSAFVKEGDTSAKFIYYHDGWNGEWYYLTAADIDNYQLTSWENVYISFFVYSADVLNFNFRYSEDIMEQAQTNVANEWTKITCSLRQLGITSLEDLSSPKLRCRVLANTENKEYTFYVDGFKLESVVLPAMEDGTLDLSLVSANGDANCTGEISSQIKYGESSISSIKYTFTNNGITYENQQDGPKTGRILLDDESILFNNCSVTDWSTAYVRFYIKNTTGEDVRLAPRFQTATGEGDAKQWKGTVLKYEWWQNKAVDIGKTTTDWTLVEISLADIAANCDAMSGTTKGDFYTENVTDFKFCLAVCIKIPEGESVSFYIDGLEIINK